MPKKNTILSEKEIKTILAQFQDAEHVLIVLHNNPDPDALASAFALTLILQQTVKVDVSIAYDGMIGRAENRAMVNLLKIPLKQFNRIHLEVYDHFAMVDTQPGASNHPLPQNIHCDLVIDHHPYARNKKIKHTVIDTEIGATATILFEWMTALDLPISADLATALVYAIRSETQDLGRETSKRDIAAYLNVYPQASMRKLARIVRPTLSSEYFAALTKTLARALTYKNMIIAHIGELHTPEVVAEMADFLLRHKGTGWTLVTGRFKEGLYLSLRSSSAKAQAGKLIKQIVPERNTAGGHGTFAGGRIDIADADDVADIENKLVERFAKKLGYDAVEWRRFVGEQEKEA